MRYYYDNYYRHCDTSWLLEGCDCMHNDRCPECDQEVSPVLSEEYIEDIT